MTAQETKPNKSLIRFLIILIVMGIDAGFVWSIESNIMSTNEINISDGIKIFRIIAWMLLLVIGAFFAESFTSLFVIRNNELADNESDDDYKSEFTGSTIHTMGNPDDDVPIYNFTDSVSISDQNRTEESFKEKENVQTNEGNKTKI